MDIRLRFTDKEITPWGGLSLMKQMLDHLRFDDALTQAEMPAQRSNRGYSPSQLVTQFLLNIWCGGNRFEHAEMVRHDAVLRRLFGFVRMANFKALIRFFNKFSQASNEHVFGQLYRWLFEQIAMVRLTLDLDSTVMTRYGVQEGAAKGYNPKNKGRASHHPLLAFVADWRLVANFWLRPGNTASSNNFESFIESTLENLGDTKVGLLRADSGFYDKAVVALLRTKNISHIISARLTQGLQQAIVDQCKWQQVEVGLEVSELLYQPQGWQTPQRLVVVRQHVKRRGGAVAGKTMSLFADDPDLQGWRYGAMLTDLSLPALEVWRLYRGRADCENRIKELKADFGLDSFVLRDFWATEAALGVTMLSYNLMSVFRHAVMRQKVHHTLSTLHHQVLAVGALWDDSTRNIKQTFRLAVARKRRPWFDGLWANAGEPVKLTPVRSNS